MLTTRYGTAGFEAHHRPPGSVMQEEIDHFWDALSAGGDPKAQQCGWLKDRYGLSWQIVPDNMDELFTNENSPGTQRTMEAMLTMKKIDIAALCRAHDGAE